MNKSVIFVALSALATTSVFAESEIRDEPLDHVRYHYGMDLDVKRVISLTSAKGNLGVAPATLVYEDSQGHVKAIDFIQATGLGKEG